MKVIGQTEYGYILEASHEEVSNYAGYYGIDKRGRFPVRTEIRVSPQFDQLRFLKSRQGTLENIVSLLREYAGKLELIDPIAIKEISEGKEEIT